MTSDLSVLENSSLFRLLVEQRSEGRGGRVVLSAFSDILVPDDKTCKAKHARGSLTSQITCTLLKWLN